MRDAAPSTERRGRMNTDPDGLRWFKSSASSVAGCGASGSYSFSSSSSMIAVKMPGVWWGFAATMLSRSMASR